MNLTMAQEGKEYIIQRIETDDEELDAFLFSLGCYSGEPITVVSRKKKNCVVSIKDGRTTSTISWLRPSLSDLMEAGDNPLIVFYPSVSNR